ALRRGAAISRVWVLCNSGGCRDATSITCVGVRLSRWILSWHRLFLAYKGVRMVLLELWQGLPWNESWGEHGNLHSHFSWRCWGQLYCRGETLSGVREIDGITVAVHYWSNGRVKAPQLRCVRSIFDVSIVSRLGI